MTEGRSFKRLGGLCVELLAVVPPLNILGIVIFCSLACDLVNGKESLVQMPWFDL